MTIREAVIVEAVRTPVGKRNGQLAGYHPTDLLALTLKHLVEKAGVDPDNLDDIVAGCGRPIAKQSSNIARWASLGAGFPEHIPGTSIDRACGSGQQAVTFVNHAIIGGEYRMAIGCGVESMTHADLGPMFNPEYGAPDWYGDMCLERYGDRLVGQGIAAEMLAEKYGITRDDMDEFAVQSHLRAAKASDEGFYLPRMVPIEIDGPDGEKVLMTRDEGIRPNPDKAKLGTLKAVFKKDGMVTGGNSSQMSDGAGALLQMDVATAEKAGLKPLARIVAAGVSGADPVLTFEGIIPASERALANAGMTIDQIDRAEVNEAFACVPLLWLQHFKYDPERMNVNGGAISMGHPLGSTGPRLLTDLIGELQKSNTRYGMLTICTSGGMANCTIIERL